MGKPAYVVGLDLGDGESAIAWAARTGPRDIRLFDRSHDEVSVVTAIGTVNDTQEIGERALRDPYVQHIRTHFKTRPVRTRVGLGTGLLTAHFGKLFVEEFHARFPTVADDCVLYVGHPAGWPDDAVEAYREELESALHPFDVRLVPESQSAFVHLHDERQVDPSTRPVLVVDIGSSTIDFTLVTERAADNLPFGDGEEIGCRAIDRRIREVVLDRLADSAEAGRLRSERWQALLLWLCRRHKEATFAGVPSTAPDDPTDELRRLLEVCWETLLAVDVEALVSEPDGWKQCLRSELEQVREHLGENQPKLVLTTGGGSRMPFVEDLCTEVFGPVVAPVREPALSVARGLASYGRWRIRIDTFREGVKQLAESEPLGELIANEARPFARRLYLASNKWLVEPGNVPDDVYDVRDRLRPFNEWLMSTDGRAVRDEVFGPFEAKLGRELAPVAERLCVDCGLPADALETRLVLPPDLFVLSQGWLKAAADAVDPADRALTPIFGPLLNAGTRLVGYVFGERVFQVGGELLGRSFAASFDLTEQGRADLTAAVREQVREQLLERAKGIESLLA